MRIVVAGASGFVGSALVAVLSARGHEVVPAGRDPAALTAAFPDHSVTGYDDLPNTAHRFDVLVNAAGAPGAGNLRAAELADANARFPLRCLDFAKSAEIAQFVHLSSVHTIERERRDPYAISKRQGDEALTAAEPGACRVTIAHIAAVHGNGWRGRLSVLNRLPPALASSLFPLLTALRPVTSIGTLADFIEQAEVRLDRTVAVTDGQQGNKWYGAFRLLLDLAFAVVAVGLLAIMALPLAILIRRESDGPALFRQPRVGRHGSIFTLLKFRTMSRGTPQTGTHDAPPDAVTGIGAFLRRTRIDELPQALNVLAGSMTLIGPRPSLPVQAALIEARARRNVLDLKPGLTGLAQSEGIDMRDPVRLARRDADYKALQSVTTDLAILLRTTGLRR